MDNQPLRDRTGEVLFIDARKLGRMENRVQRTLDPDDIAKIAGTYHAWRGDGGDYADIPGFRKAATLDEIGEHGFVLTPGRYVGAEAVEQDSEPFEEKMQRLVATLEQQFSESAKLEAAIRGNLRVLGFVEEVRT